MKLDWTKNLKTEEEKKNFQDLLKRSTIIFGRLRDMIKGHISALDRNEGTISDFDQPNWAEKQAFRNGVRSTHQFYLDLIDFDKKENK